MIGITIMVRGSHHLCMDSLTQCFFVRFLFFGFQFGFKSKTICIGPHLPEERINKNGKYEMCVCVCVCVCVNVSSTMQKFNLSTFVKYHALEQYASTETYLKY